MFEFHAHPEFKKESRDNQLFNVLLLLTELDSFPNDDYLSDIERLNRTQGYNHIVIEGTTVSSLIARQSTIEMPMFVANVAPVYFTVAHCRDAVLKWSYEHLDVMRAIIDDERQQSRGYADLKHKLNVLLKTYLND